MLKRDMCAQTPYRHTAILHFVDSLYLSLSPFWVIVKLMQGVALRSLFFTQPFDVKWYLQLDFVVDCLAEMERGEV